VARRPAAGEPVATPAAEPTTAAAPVDEQVDQGDDGGRAPAPSGGLAAAVLAPPGGGDAAGFLLGLIVWGWVVLPFLRSGTTGVRDMWRAKFLNKDASGEWLS
jgi:hypothetical protein